MVFETSDFHLIPVLLYPHMVKLVLWEHYNTICGNNIDCPSINPSIYLFANNLQIIIM